MKNEMYTIFLSHYVIDIICKSSTDYNPAD